MQPRNEIKKKYSTKVKVDNFIKLFYDLYRKLFRLHLKKCCCKYLPLIKYAFFSSLVISDLIKKINKQRKHAYIQNGRDKKIHTLPHHSIRVYICLNFHLHLFTRVHSENFFPFHLQNGFNSPQFAYNITSN